MYTFVGNCRQCGYPLVRLTEPRCPECGTPFDPDDPASMQLHPSRVQDFLLKKITLWTLFPAFIACGAAGATILRPMPGLGAAVQLAAILILLVTFYICTARYRFQSWLKRRKREQERERRLKGHL